MSGEPEYLKDAAAALNKAYATGDQKMADDVHEAFDRNAAIEQAQQDMK